jgi:hypothetical protein
MQVSRFHAAELDLLVYWMTERDRIRALKENGAPKPWTTDPLLRDYRWCNVRRMDDRVSRWLLANWYGCRDDAADQLVGALYARLINWPEALAAFIEERAPEDARRILKERARAGLKVFTGAYVVPGVAGKNKVDSVIDLIDLVYCNPHYILQATTMRDTWERLTRLAGIGSFLAGQIVADLATQGIGAAWPDRATWAPLGPGSARGLNRVLGRPKVEAVSQTRFDWLLPELCAELKPRVADLWRDRDLIAMDIQNCLCEFDKYRRLTLKEGTVRARYDGAGAAHDQVSLL